MRKRWGIIQKMCQVESLYHHVQNVVSVGGHIEKATRALLKTGRVAGILEMRPLVANRWRNIA